MARHRHHRRRHSRGLLGNPFSATGLLSTPKQMISSGFIMESAGVAAGFVLPGVLLNYVPATWKAAKWQYYAVKVGAIAVLSAAARMVSSRVSRFVMVGGGVSLLLDLYTEFIGIGLMAPATTTAPAPTAAPATSSFFGNPGQPGVGLFTGSPGMPGVGDIDFEIP